MKFIVRCLSMPYKSFKTKLPFLLLLNFAFAKKLLEKQHDFVTFLGGTNFIQKFISISKNWPRLMNLSEIHQHIFELVWKKFGWWNFIPSWEEFCVCVLFSLVLGWFVILKAGIYACYMIRQLWSSILFVTPILI